jgi:aspartate aminotransferase-like enzyme
VLTIQAEEKYITQIKALAKKKGFLLGEGYGDLKKNTFRISNFPALQKKEIEALMSFLKKHI